MGKKWFEKKNRNRPGGSNDGKGYKKPKREDVVKQNNDFEIFYKTQKIVPEKDWLTFLTVMKQELPCTIRFLGSNPHAEALIEMIQKKIEYCKTYDNIQDVELKCLPWYPDKQAWQMNITRQDILNSQTFWNLHQFLISKTETGNICRQETVSLIPPLLLDVKPHHKVLDMCAAPGVKTGQILDFLHSNQESTMPSGILIANDVDHKRCSMLSHQSKQLQRPSLLITKNDAAFMPNVHLKEKDGSIKILKYDRILCDIPCSADGSFRKNFNFWSRWNAYTGASLHGLQYRIGRRAIEQLAVGGRIVYCSYSLNPMENESVINCLLAEFENYVQLVDITESLKGIRYVHGMTRWTVMNRQLRVIPTVKEIPPYNMNDIHRYLFPPSQQDAKKRHLTRCIRILPHHQNTGCLFVAVLEKQQLLPGEKLYETGMPPKKKRRYGQMEEPHFLDEEDEVWKNLETFYGFDGSVQPSNFFSRSETGRGKNLYLVNDFVRDVIQCNWNRMKIIDSGVKALMKCDDSNPGCNYRITLEGVHVLVGLCGDRKLKVRKEDLIYLLKIEDGSQPGHMEKLHEETQELANLLDSGCVILQCEDEGGEEPPFEINLVGFKGKRTLKCFVHKGDRVHYLRLLGIEASELEKPKVEEQKITTIGTSIGTTIGTTIGPIGSSIDTIGSSMDTLGSSIDTIGSSMDTLGSSIDTIGSSMDTIGSSIDTIGSSIGTIGTTIGTIGTTIGTIGTNIDTIGTTIGPTIGVQAEGIE